MPCALCLEAMWLAAAKREDTNPAGASMTLLHWEVCTDPKGVQSPVHPRDSTSCQGSRSGGRIGGGGLVALVHSVRAHDGYGGCTPSSILLYMLLVTVPLLARSRPPGTTYVAITVGAGEGWSGCDIPVEPSQFFFLLLCSAISMMHCPTWRQVTAAVLRRRIT